jgi:hypothetical protein
MGDGLVLTLKCLLETMAEVALFCILKKLKVGAFYSVFTYFKMGRETTLFFYAGGFTMHPLLVNR